MLAVKFTIVDKKSKVNKTEIKKNPEAVDMLMINDDKFELMN